MLSIDIPGWKALRLDFLVFDYNGTLALDGKISDYTKKYLSRLAEKFNIHILTSDTFGSVMSECGALPVTIKRLESENHTQEKAAYLKQLGIGQIAAIGNGTNDKLMLETADLGIAIIGPEGCSPETLLRADIVVNRIEEAFELFLNPQRLIASLRR